MNIGLVNSSEIVSSDSVNAGCIAFSDSEVAFNAGLVNSSDVVFNDNAGCIAVSEEHADGNEIVLSDSHVFVPLTECFVHNSGGQDSVEETKDASASNCHELCKMLPYMKWCLHLDNIILRVGELLWNLTSILHFGERDCMATVISK